MPLPAKLGAIFFTLIGVALLVYAMSLAPFTTGSNPAVWQSKVPDRNSVVYKEVRTAHLTNKYSLQDYGASSLLVAALCVLAGNARRLRAPGSKKAFLWLAIGLPCATLTADVFSGYQQILRYVAPHWADSFAIALAEGVFLCIVAWAVAIPHLAFLWGVSVQKPSAMPLMLALSVRQKGNLWLRVMMWLSILGLIEAIIGGRPWWILASVGWVYYFMSLFSVRSQSAPVIDSMAIR